MGAPNNLKWDRTAPGEYASRCGRFRILELHDICILGIPETKQSIVLALSLDDTKDCAEHYATPGCGDSLPAAALRPPAAPTAGGRLLGVV